jgi:hypothetical protein
VKASLVFFGDVGVRGTHLPVGFQVDVEILPENEEMKSSTSGRFSDCRGCGGDQCSDDVVFGCSFSALSRGRGPIHDGTKWGRGFGCPAIIWWCWAFFFILVGFVTA